MCKELIYFLSDIENNDKADDENCYFLPHKEGVLYTGESDDSQVLTERLKQDKNAEGELVFTPLVALSFMLFVLIYFPCIATISAIVHGSGSWKWGIFVIVYTCVLAWFVSCVVYQTGHFFMNLFN